MAEWLGLCVSTAGIGFLLRECHVAQQKKKKNHDIICVNLLSKPFKSM